MIDDGENDQWERNQSQLVKFRQTLLFHAIQAQCVGEKGVVMGHQNPFPLTPLLACLLHSFVQGFEKNDFKSVMPNAVDSVGPLIPLILHELFLPGTTEDATM